MGTALRACEVCGGFGFYFSKENLISPIAEHEHHMILGIVNDVSYWVIFFFFLKQGNPHIPVDGPKPLHMWAAQIASGSNNFLKVRTQSWEGRGVGSGSWKS